MRTSSLPLASIVALLAATAGCQLVAGVRTDAEPTGPTSGSTSSVGGGGGSTTSSSSTSSTGGAGPCMGPMDCTEAGSVCVDGACVQPTCSPSAIVDIFGESEIGADMIEDANYAIASDGDRLYVAIDDLTAKKVIVRGVSENGSTDPIQTYAYTNFSRLRRGRWGSNVLSLQGVVDGAIGHLQWTTQAGGLSGPPTFVPYAHGCTAPKYATEVLIAPRANANKFIALCSDGTKADLVVGGDDDTDPQVIDSGMPGDPGFHIDRFAVTNNAWLAFAKFNDAYEYRGGPSKASLATTHPFAFTNEMDFVAFASGLGVTPAEDAFVVTGLNVRFAPLVDELYTGISSDVSTLATVPPSSLSVQISGPSPPDEFFGEDTDLLSTTLGYFYATRSGNRKHARLSWLSPKAQTLLFSSPTFSAPDDQTTITGTGLGVIGTRPFIVWTEKAGGKYRVRGAVHFCTY